MTKEDLSITETLLDTAAEQSLELDFLLPDYEPEVFRLLKTRVQPVIQQIHVNGNRVELGGVCNVSVLYLGEDQNTLQAARQSAPFSKTLELKKEADPDCMVQCVPRCYFVNARAVSSRRLEVRCGISLRTKVMAQTMQSFVAEADGIQIHKTPVNCCCERITAVKSCTMSEDLELGQAKPAFHSLLDASYQITLTEKKVMANKMIIRGDLLTRILYCPEGGGRPETMEWSEPISQIMDLPGIDEEYTCDIQAGQINGTFETMRGDGECRTLSAEWTMLFTAVCDKNEEKSVTDDGFSCQFVSSPVIEMIPLNRIVTAISQTIPVTTSMAVQQIESLLSILTSMGESSCRLEEGKLILSGTVEVTAIYCTAEGIMTADKSVLFEAVLDAPAVENASFSPSITVSSASGTLSSEGIDLRLQLSVCGILYQTVQARLLTNMQVDESQPLTRSDAALRICYAEPQENLWEIAKRCRTSLSAIMEENGLQSERVSERQMLLIPMLQE